MPAAWNVQQGALIREDTAPFTDTIEMAGHRIAAIITYGRREDGTLHLSRQLVYPQLHTVPRDTFSTLHCCHEQDALQPLTVDGTDLREYPAAFRLDGAVTVTCTDADRRISVTRRLFPAVELPCYIEYTTVTNDDTLSHRIRAAAVDTVDYRRGSEGVYADRSLAPAADKELSPGESLTLTQIFCAGFHRDAPPAVDGGSEWQKRRRWLDTLMDGSLHLRCDDEELETFFRFAKLRAAESIFDTVSGPLHSPGGGPYYAAVWANDQAEYAGPFFPFMGYDRANAASRNAYDLFSRFMAPTGTPIPSSIIDEGRDIWEGAGDRGDGAMYLYGCARYLLALGDRAAAEERFWTIEWAADYCLSKKNEHGVIASDSDELEERLPSGDANLCTSCLTYGGLLSAADLAEDLECPDKAAFWRAEAAALETAIESYFGAAVSGYDTYRYYDGNDVLRSWICMPLTMDITTRAGATTDALLSDKLFRGGGCLSAEGDEIFWDRSTLYAFRGILQTGGGEKVYPYLRDYVHTRLRGDHVPYAVEAWPEGDQRHLSAESALFCRVVTEGLCGIRPVGLNRVRITPSLPPQMSALTLTDIHCGGTVWDLSLANTADGTAVTVWVNGQVAESRTVPAGDSFELILP